MQEKSGVVHNANQLEILSPEYADGNSLVPRASDDGHPCSAGLSPEDTCVDKVLADFLAELQALSDSLPALGETVAPVPGAEQSGDVPGEALLRIGRKHDGATQSPNPTEDASDNVPDPPVCDIRSLLSQARPPLKAKRRARQRSYSYVEAVRQRGRTLLWAGISVVILCLVGGTYRLDPFGLAARWKPNTPPAPSVVSSMPGPTPAGTAGPIEKTLPALPTPRVSRSPLASQQATRPAPIPIRPTIGVSYGTVTARLDGIFAMKKASPFEGQERYAGRTDNNMAGLEVIGNKERVSEACLTARLPGDDPRAAERNVGFAFSFIQNIEPGWVDAPNWIADSLVNLSNSETELIEITRGKRRVRLRWMKATGTMSISVRSVGQKEPLTGHGQPE